MAARNLVLLLILCTAVKAVQEGLICPDFKMPMWKLKVENYNCRDGMTYHCAKKDDKVFVEGCATKMKCDKGEEPWFVEKNKVQCRSCTDPERFQLVPRWSYEISQCERERYLCPYGIHQILCDNGNTKSPRTCRCDYLNNYVPIVEKDKGCRISNDLHCVLDSPCKEDEERLQSNYSCVPKISFNPDQTMDPFIDSGSVQTTSNTPPPTTTSTTSTTTEQSKTTTAPPDDNGISNILTINVVIWLYLTNVIIGTMLLRFVKIMKCKASRHNNKDKDRKEDPARTPLQLDNREGAGTSHQADTEGIKWSAKEILLLICVCSVFGGIGIALMLLCWKKFHVKELPVEFVTPLHDTEVSQQGTAVLDCEINKPDAKATWYKNGEPITVRDDYNIRVDKTHHSLFLEKVSLDDTAEYKIVIQDKSSQAKFAVKVTERPIPQRPTDGNSPSDVEPATDTSELLAEALIHSSLRVQPETSKEQGQETPAISNEDQKSPHTDPQPGGSGLHVQDLNARVQDSSSRLPDALGASVLTNETHLHQLFDKNRRTF